MTDADGSGYRTGQTKNRSNVQTESAEAGNGIQEWTYEDCKKEAATEYYNARALEVLKKNLVLWWFDPTYWLRDNFPTLAGYLGK